MNSFRSQKCGTMVLGSCFLLLPIFLLPNCGGGSAKVLTRPTGKNGSLNVTQAQSLAGDYNAQFLAIVTGLFDGTSIPEMTSYDESLLLTAMNQNQVAKALDFGLLDFDPVGCAGVSNPVSTVNLDGDNVPVTSTLTYSCSVSKTRGTASVTGTGTLIDKDDNHSLGGFAATLSNLIFDYTSLGIKFTYNSDVSSTKAESSYSGKYDVELTIASPVGSGFLGNYLDVAVTPTNMLAPGFSGAVTLSGWLKIEGKASLADTNVTMQLSSQDLTYSSSCSGLSGFNGGSITFTNGDDKSIVSTFYSSCAATHTYDGQSVTPTQ